MGDCNCKRCAPTIAAMEDASSSETIISKKRRTSASYSCELLLRSPDTPRHLDSHYSLDIMVSPEASVDSAGTVVSAEFCSDRSPISCCSSSCVVETSEVVKHLDATPLDLEVQTKGFETVDTTSYHNFKSFSLLSEFSGDSEELTTFPAAASERQKPPAVKMPPTEEIEEFFALAEKYEQKRFEEKYNFDIVADMPLEGRYHWIRLH